LVRHPLAYTASEKVIEILALSNLDPPFVDEAARGFGILAEGKGKGRERGSHLTAKVRLSEQFWWAKLIHSFFTRRSCGTLFCLNC
jgi:DNA repair/transcription protein MET18/MMS19